MKPETYLLEYVLSSSLTNVDLNNPDPPLLLRVSLCGSQHASLEVSSVWLKFFGILHLQMSCTGRCLMDHLTLNVWQHWIEPGLPHVEYLHAGAFLETSDNTCSFYF